MLAGRPHKLLGDNKGNFAGQSIGVSAWRCNILQRLPWEPRGRFRALRSARCVLLFVMPWASLLRGRAVVAPERLALELSQQNELALILASPYPCSVASESLVLWARPIPWAPGPLEACGACTWSGVWLSFWLNCWGSCEKIYGFGAGRIFRLKTGALQNAYFKL